MIYNEKMIIVKVQQLIALVGIIVGLIATSAYIIVPARYYAVNERIFNMLSVFLITAAFSITFFINRKGIRLFQTLTIIIVAILSILFEKRVRIAGDVFFIIGLLLLYAYRFIKKFRWYQAFIIFAVMGSLKFLGSSMIDPITISQNLYVSFFSSLLIAIVVIIVKEYISSYNEFTRLNNALHRISINASSFLFNFNLENLVSKLYGLFPAEMLFNGNMELVKEVYNIGGLIGKKDNERRQLIAALKLNGKTGLEDVNVSAAINNIILLHQTDTKVYKSIDFFAEHDEDLTIRIAPADLYFMLQNIFTNIIEGLMRIKEHRQVSIMTKKEGELAVINIYYSGVKFKSYPPQKDKLFDFTPVWCKGIEYMRFLNARDMVYSYKGTIEFGNKVAKGYFILIKLPVFTPDPVGKKKCLEDTISQTL